MTRLVNESEAKKYLNHLYRKDLDQAFLTSTASKVLTHSQILTMNKESVNALCQCMNALPISSNSSISAK